MDLQYGIYSMNQTGTLHIEGVTIHGTASGRRSCSRRDRVRPFRCRTHASSRCIPSGGVHTDAIQSWAGPYALRLYNVTLRSSGLSLQVQPYEYFSGSLGQWHYERVEHGALDACRARTQQDGRGRVVVARGAQGLWLKPIRATATRFTSTGSTTRSGWNPGGNAGTITGEPINIGRRLAGRLRARVCHRALVPN